MKSLTISQAGSVIDFKVEPIDSGYTKFSIEHGGDDLPSMFVFHFTEANFTKLLDFMKEQ